MRQIREIIMPITFNMLLCAANLELTDVRLLRHKDNRSTKGKTPHELWRYNRPQFNLYQSTQRVENRSKFKAPYWATFLGTPAAETLFVGIYRAEYRGLLDKDQPMPHRDGVDKAGTCDLYDLTLDDKLSEFIGLLLIDWGPGDRAWVQRADKQDKRVTELRAKLLEPDFPGYLNFMEPLSKLDSLPKGWTDALRCSSGVYLLVCPKTKEQYVGSATGEGGFLGRWEEYVRTGDGGNEGLKSREPSDYQVSILEVAGTAATVENILEMESRWKRKFQSREMGLNRN
jgi:hypothetical protein